MAASAAHSASALEAPITVAGSTALSVETWTKIFVQVSTDKAVDPATVMGASKALAEWAAEAANARYEDTAYASVRFGNVLNSSGSVVPIFRRQIEAGGPVTVTDPEMTRFFMTIPEAVQLVIRAGSLVQGGEVFVLEMGEPVKILDVAHHLIRLAAQPVKVEFTGLRVGEKLHEELFGEHEPRDVRPWHPQVSHVPVVAIDPHLASSMPTSGRRDDVVAALAHACSETRNGAVHDLHGRSVGETVSRSRD